MPEEKFVAGLDPGLHEWLEMRAHAAMVKRQLGGNLKETVPSDFREKYHRNWITLANQGDNLNFTAGKRNILLNKLTPATDDEKVSLQQFSAMLDAYGFIPSDRIIYSAMNARKLRYLEMLMESNIPAINASINPLQRTMVHLACVNGDIQKLDYLLSCGADVNKRDADMRTPLHLAIKPANCLNATDILMRLLSERKLHVNWKDRKGCNALHYACIVRNEVAIEWLLRRGARMDVKDKQGKMPIDYAKEEDYSTYLNLSAKYSRKVRLTSTCATIVARSFVVNLMKEFVTHCPTCKRSHLVCCESKINNYRYWLFTHDRLKKEIVGAKVES